MDILGANGAFVNNKNGNFLHNTEKTAALQQQIGKDELKLLWAIAFIRHISLATFNFKKPRFYGILHGEGL